MKYKELQALNQELLPNKNIPQVNKSYHSTIKIGGTDWS